MLSSPLRLCLKRHLVSFVFHLALAEILSRSEVSLYPVHKAGKEHGWTRHVAVAEQIGMMLTWLWVLELEAVLEECMGALLVPAVKLAALSFSEVQMSDN